MHALATNDIILSLHPRFLNSFLDGRKCVELRRRAPRISPGTRVWLYTKAPMSQIAAVAVLQEIVIGHPHELWRRFARCAGISAEEFSSYFYGAEEGSVLAFSKVFPLVSSLSLRELRNSETNFHPPQFYKTVRPGALSDVLQTAVLGKPRCACNH